MNVQEVSRQTGDSGPAGGAESAESGHQGAAHLPVLVEVEQGLRVRPGVFSEMHGTGVGSSADRSFPAEVDDLRVRSLKGGPQLRVSATVHLGAREVLPSALLLPNGVPVQSPVQADPLSVDFRHKVVGKAGGLEAPPADRVLEEVVVHGGGVWAAPVELQEEEPVVLHPGQVVAEERGATQPAGDPE